MFPLEKNCLFAFERKKSGVGEERLNVNSFTFYINSLIAIFKTCMQE